MAFINMNLGEAKEKEVLPEGEYDLVIEDYTPVMENDKLIALSVRHSVDGHPEAKAVFNRINLPTEGDTEEKRNNKLLFAIAYLALFGIEWTAAGFDTDELQGSRGKCFLKVQEYEGVLSNQIKLRI